MTRMWIVVGDATTSGGRVVTGSPFTNIDGKPVARVRDQATCPTHNGTFPIVDGDPTTVIDGEAVALHGSSLSCGCKVLAVQQSRVFLAVDNVAASPSVTNAPSRAASAFVGETSAGRARRITGVSWSYGAEARPLATKSRHYSDLNLHVKTENYDPGEFVEIAVRTDATDEPATFACRATVGPDGIATLMNVFDDRHLPLFARK